MARAHSFSVIDAVITALRAIDANGSDSFTPTIVQRHDEDRSVEAVPGAIIVRRSGTTRGREASGSGWLIDLTIEILCNVFTGEDSDSSSDQAIEEAEEDVWRSLVGVDWDTVQAELSNFNALSFRDEDPLNPLVGFVATVEIGYKVAYDSPGTVINL